MQETLIDKILGSGIPYITYAVPVFFLCIGIEVWVARRQGRQLYRFTDAINALSCGITQQMFGIFVQGLTLVGYVWLWDRYALVDVAALSPGLKWLAALVLFLGVDVCYYWFHRLSHEVAFLWAAHIVHHHSEDYNLAVALRQSVFQGWFSWVFYLPLAVLGFPPTWFVSMLALNTLYQFFVHTQAVDRLGPLEWVLNTPSHHRVHHGKNPIYIDRNHAGILIIWDKMFGTFEPEGEPVVYGTTRELRSWNPIWSNLLEWKGIWDDAREFPRWQDKVWAFLMPPGWRPATLPPEPPKPQLTPETQVKYETPTTSSLRWYVVVQFVLALAVGVVVLLVWQRWGLARSTPLVLWVVASLTAIGALFERRSWGRWVEPLRLGAGLALVWLFVPGAALVPALAAGGVVAASSVAWARRAALT